jgi:type I restriction enzyme S subunit
MTAWPAVPLKYLVDINQRTLPETTPPETEFRYIDVSTCGRGRLEAHPEPMRFADAPSRARRLVRHGDTLISTVRTYLRAVWAVTGPSDDLVVSTGFAVLSPRDRLDPRFLGWLAQSDPVIEEIVARSVGVSYPAINGLEVGELRVAVPDLATQQAIADYLDAETARIDRMVLARRRMIDLLLERRSAFISNAVESGQPTRVRRVISMCTSGPRGWGDLVADAGSMFIRSANLTRASIRIVNDGMAYVPPQSSPEATRSRVHAGDVLVGITGANTGWVGVADAAHEGGFVSQHVGILRPANINPEWLAYSLASDRGQRALLGSQYGGTKTQLGLDDLRELEIRVPDQDTQRAALGAVRRVEVTTQATVDVTQRQVELLLERRQALITAAVAGQLDITGVAA